jgi:hypothetical protein
MQIQKQILNTTITLSKRGYKNANKYYILVKSAKYEVRLSSNTLSELLSLFQSDFHYGFTIKTLFITSLGDLNAIF